MRLHEVFKAMSLEGKTVAVTGGATGIGYAAAELLGQMGARCALLDVNGQAAGQAAGTLGKQSVEARAYAADISSEADVLKAFDQIESEFGGVDILINNAGLVKREASVDIPISDWRRVIDVNLTGAFLCARTAARGMIARRSGSIINISSIGGQSGGKMYPNPAYRASKGGLINLTRALAVEWAPFSIRVNSVAPGYVKTDMTRNITSDAQRQKSLEESIPLGRMADPKDIAWAIAFLVSPVASLITGQTLTVDGGVLA